MQQSLQFDYLFKYILIGDASVGKSTLLQYYINRQFRDSSNPTMGVQFATKKLKVQNKLIKIQIWDTAGQQSFRTITRAYYKNAIGIILMYDLTNPNSFKNIQSWFDQINQNSNQKKQIIIVGNKTDLCSNNYNKYEGEYQFLATSAKTGMNIDNLFSGITQKILKKIDDGQIPIDGTVGVKKGKSENKKLVSSLHAGSFHQNQPKNKKCC